jgi:hypothetical protein
MKVDAENDVLNCSVTCYRYDRERNKLNLDYYNRLIMKNIVKGLSNRLADKA